DPPPAGGAAGILQGCQRLGGGRLGRARGATAPRGRGLLGGAELVPVLGSRAPGGPRGRDPDWHVPSFEGSPSGAGKRDANSSGCRRTGSTASRASSPTPSG